MNQIGQIQSAIDFIEANLDSDIDIADVAREAAISRWHFQRTFRALTGETVKTYVRSRRLAWSLDQLLLTDRRIIDIAIDVRYESQASFTRAFKQQFGLAPAAYRKLGDGSLFLKKVEIDIDYLNHIAGNVSMQPEMVERQAMTVVGLRTTFYGADSEKNNVSQKLPALWAEFGARMDEVADRTGTDAYGVITQISRSDEQLDYCACIEVVSSDVGNAVASDAASRVIPEGMVVMEIPAATYATFEHRGPATNLDNTVNYAYSTWLLPSEFRHSYGADLEIYGARYDPVSDESIVHYAIPVVDTMVNRTTVDGT